jgi:hypothetical protein
VFQPKIFASIGLLVFQARHLSSTTAAGKGTTQVYEKAGSSLQVLIYEGWYYTWTELSATRIIGREQAPAR